MLIGQVQVFLRHKIEKELSFTNEPQLLYMHTHWSGLESQASNAESFACSYNQLLQLLKIQILLARPGITGSDPIAFNLFYHYLMLQKMQLFLARPLEH